MTYPAGNDISEAGQPHLRVVGWPDQEGTAGMPAGTQFANAAEDAATATTEEPHRPADDLDDLSNVDDPHHACPEELRHDTDSGEVGYLDDEYGGQLTDALFPGDEGSLDLAQRKALVTLLKRRFITAMHDATTWRVLVAEPRAIQARLNDLFLDLHIDPDRGVAFKRQVPPEAGSQAFPTLLHDNAWSREETILLVWLRSQGLRQSEVAQDRVFVDRDDMLDHVAADRPEHATDQAGDARRTERAIDSLITADLLVRTAVAERYEVSPAIDVLLPIAKLKELVSWLTQQNQAPGADPPSGPDAQQENDLTQLRDTDTPTEQGHPGSPDDADPSTQQEGRQP